MSLIHFSLQSAADNPMWQISHTPWHVRSVPLGLSPISFMGNRITGQVRAVFFLPGELVPIFEPPS